MNASDSQVRSAITQVAADWYAAHRIGPLSAADRAAFLAWLKASPIHIEEYLGIAALQRSLTAASDDSSLSVDALVDLAHADLDGNVLSMTGSAARDEPPRFRPVRRLWLSMAATACMGIAALSVLWWVRADYGYGSVKTYRTGHGEQGTWPLPDGSILHVNTDSKVTVRFSAAERLLELDQGQLAIEVTHRDPRVLRVHAGSTDTVAVGTAFDVYRRAHSTLITVVTGQVAVSIASPTTRRIGTPGLSSGLRVGAGQQVRVVAGVLPAAPQATDLKETTAWLDRKIVFDQRPLGTVADEFNRYNAVLFTIDDPVLRSLPVSGTFNANDTESFAAFLGSLEGVRVERQPTRFNILNSIGKH